MSLAIATVTCGGTSTERPTASPPRATQTAATPSVAAAEAYVRTVAGFDYAPVPPIVEAQTVGTGGIYRSGIAESYAIREVSERRSGLRMRLLVWRLADQYASEQILDDEVGFGGRTEPPRRMTIRGLPAFYHSDVVPSFLVWQQGRHLVLVYGDEVAAMERLASGLIAANGSPR